MMHTLFYIETTFKRLIEKWSFFDPGPVPKDPAIGDGDGNRTHKMLFFIKNILAFIQRLEIIRGYKKVIKYYLQFICVIMVCFTMILLISPYTFY